MSDEARQTEEEKASNSGRYGTAGGMGMGIPIGLSFGVTIGLVLDNMAIGIAIGLTFGVALGTAFSQERDEHEESATRESLPESQSNIDRN